MSLRIDQAERRALQPTPGVWLANRAAAFADVAAAPYLYVALLALMTLPVLIWPIPRSADIVNHWARLTLLTMSADDPLNALYSVHFAIIPNLGLDLLYLALSPVLSAQSVARLGWALSFWLPAFGAWRLHRALFAKPQVTILLVPLISYNLVVTAGLVNYGFGMGLALLALAWRVNSDRKRIWRCLVVLNLVSVALLLCHALALLGFCVAFGLWELARGRGESWRVAAMRGLLSPLYVALGIGMLALSERSPSGFALVGQKSRIVTAPFQAMTEYDLVFALAIAGLLLVARLSRRLSLAPAMMWPLLGFAAFVVVVPSAWGAANLIDARLSVFAAHLALAALASEWRGRPARLLAVLIALVAVARIASVAPDWARFEANAATLRSAFAAIPRGARVLVVRPPGGVCSDPDLPMLSNLSTLAVIDRRAGVNSLFADSGMQPIRPRDEALAGAPKIAISSAWLTPVGRAPLGESAGEPWAQAYVHWREHFDMVVAMHGRCAFALDIPGLDRIAASPLADVYNIR